MNADNPAISFVVDGQAHTNTQGDDGVAFMLATGELFISAPIDPFLRGYASINGTTDESFNIEEAALVTTALPYNLTVKGGRFMADFGRFPHWHDEALPFVDRPPSIENIIGGESISEGVETLVARADRPVLPDHVRRVQLGGRGSPVRPERVRHDAGKPAARQPARATSSGRRPTSTSPTR